MMAEKYDYGTDEMPLRRATRANLLKDESTRICTPAGEVKRSKKEFLHVQLQHIRKWTCHTHVAYK